MLSELQIMNKWASVLTEYKSIGERIFEFARAIEAEVRKQDVALIQQMLEALNTCDESYGYNGPYQFHDDEAVEAAITAARARLGEMPA